MSGNPVGSQVAVVSSGKQKLAFLRYVLLPFGCGVRRKFRLASPPEGKRLESLSRMLKDTEQLKVAVEDAFERAFQALFVGLKAAWLIPETGGTNYGEAFFEKVSAPFNAQEGLSGMLLINFLDSFLLDYDTIADNIPQLVGHEDIEDERLYKLLLSYDVDENIDDLAEAAWTELRNALINVTELEEEHPALRLGAFDQIVLNGILAHFQERIAEQPEWASYVDFLDAEVLEADRLQAIMRQDPSLNQMLTQEQMILDRITRYRDNLGAILPNREWLFDLADRLEDNTETIESELLKGETLATDQVAGKVLEALSEVHRRQETQEIVSAAAGLGRPSKAAMRLLRRARIDFERADWHSEGYAAAAASMGAAVWPVAGPRMSERYFREALAFDPEIGVNHYNLYMLELHCERYDRALEHLQEAIRLDPNRFEPFDLKRFTIERILGAGGTGITFEVTAWDGRHMVVKTLWDEVSTLNPRDALQGLQHFINVEIPGAETLYYLLVHRRSRTCIVSEYIEGENLETFRRARGGHIPPQQAAEIGWKLADVLGGSHQRNILHNNLKLENIRVGAGEDGLAVTLTDFAVPNFITGLPDRVAGVRRFANWSRLGRKISEDLVHSVAPEILTAGMGAASPRSDIYSLGVSLFRSLTGFQPREAGLDCLPEAFRELIGRCLAPDPAMRPQSVEEVRPQLQALAGQLPKDSPTKPKERPFGDAIPEIEDELPDISVLESELPDGPAVESDGFGPPETGHLEEKPEDRVRKAYSSETVSIPLMQQSGEGPGLEDPLGDIDLPELDGFGQAAPAQTGQPNPFGQIPGSGVHQTTPQQPQGFPQQAQPYGQQGFPPQQGFPQQGQPPQGFPQQPPQNPGADPFALTLQDGDPGAPGGVDPHALTLSDEPPGGPAGVDPHALTLMDEEADDPSGFDPAGFDPAMGSGAQTLNWSPGGPPGQVGDWSQPQPGFQQAAPTNNPYGEDLGIDQPLPELGAPGQPDPFGQIPGSGVHQTTPQQPQGFPQQAQPYGQQGFPPQQGFPQQGQPPQGFPQQPPQNPGADPFALTLQDGDPGAPGGVDPHALTLSDEPPGGPAGVDPHALTLMDEEADELPGDAQPQAFPGDPSLGFPQQQPGFPQQQTGFPQQQPGFPQQAGGLDQGFPQQQPGPPVGWNPVAPQAQSPRPYSSAEFKAFGTTSGNPGLAPVGADDMDLPGLPDLDLGAQAPEPSGLPGLDDPLDIPGINDLGGLPQLNLGPAPSQVDPYGQQPPPQATPGAEVDPLADLFPDPLGMSGDSSPAMQAMPGDPVNPIPGGESLDLPPPGAPLDLLPPDGFLPPGGNPLALTPPTSLQNDPLADFLPGGRNDPSAMEIPIPNLEPMAVPQGQAMPFSVPPPPPIEEEDELEPLDPMEALKLLEEMTGSRAGPPIPPPPPPQAAPNQFRSATGEFGPMTSMTGEFGALASLSGDFQLTPGASLDLPTPQWAPGAVPGAPAAMTPPGGIGLDSLSLPPDLALPPDLGDLNADDLAVPPDLLGGPPPQGGLTPPPNLDLRELEPPKAAPQAVPKAKIPRGKAAKPAPKKQKRKRTRAGRGGKARDDGYGLMISGLGLKSKKEAAIKILMEIRSISEDEARDLCRSPVVPALKGVTKEVAESAKARFKAAKINCRISKRRGRR